MVNSGKKKEDILISVIVAVYNVRDCLQSCIESLLCQSHNNIEIIVIDDGSTDGGDHVIDKYANLDKRIVAIHTVNQGISAARNVGLDAASGDFLMFVDGDDYVKKDFCKTALDVLIDHQVEVVSFGYESFWNNEDKHAINVTQWARLMNKEDAIRELIDRKDIIYNMVWNKIFSRHLFDGIRFPFGRTFEDMAVMHLAFDKVSTGIYVSDKVLYYYRQARQEGIMSNRTSPKVLYDRLKNEFDRLKFIKEKYPNLEQNQINVLARLCLQCYIYLPEREYDFNQIGDFMTTYKDRILAGFSGLMKIRIQSYYMMPKVFRLSNVVLKRLYY